LRSFLWNELRVERGACTSDLSASAGGAGSHFDRYLRPSAAAIIAAFPFVIALDLVCMNAVRVRNGARRDDDAIEGRVSGDDFQANLASIHSPQRQVDRALAEGAPVGSRRSEEGTMKGGDRGNVSPETTAGNRK
jgi:hypothetical protein